MKKRVWSLLLAAALVVGLLPAFGAGAQAAERTVYVNGVKLTAGMYWKNGDVKTATGTSGKYNAYYDGNILYLKNATIDEGYWAPGDGQFQAGLRGIYPSGDLTIDVSGTNVVDMDVSVEDNISDRVGIYAPGGNLVFQGSGKLTISDPPQNIQETNNAGIVCHGKVYINNGTLLYRGNFTGLQAKEEITINGGTVNLNGTISGMETEKLIITGGSVKSIGGYGLRAANMDVSGDTLLIAKGDGDSALRCSNVRVHDLPAFAGTKAPDTTKDPGFYAESSQYEYVVIGNAIRTLADSTVSLSYKNCTYNGKARKPAVTVKVGSKTLKEGTDYRLVYANNKNVGTATVTVKALSGSVYIGTIKKTFKINPTGTALTSLTNSSTRKASVKWTKNSAVTGYQVQFSRSSGFSSAETIPLRSASTTSTTISNLTKSKTYYVRIRTYKTVSGTKYYSAWSNAKSVKITK